MWPLLDNFLPLIGHLLLHEVQFTPNYCRAPHLRHINRFSHTHTCTHSPVCFIQINTHTHAQVCRHFHTGIEFEVHFSHINALKISQCQPVFVAEWLAMSSRGKIKKNTLVFYVWSLNAFHVSKWSGFSTVSKYMQVSPVNGDPKLPPGVNASVIVIACVLACDTPVTSPCAFCLVPAAIVCYTERKKKKKEKECQAVCLDEWKHYDIMCYETRGPNMQITDTILSKSNNAKWNFMIPMIYN